MIFSHGGIMQYQIAQVIGSKRVWGLSVRNTAMFEFTIDADGWHLDERRDRQSQPVAYRPVQ